MASDVKLILSTFNVFDAKYQNLIEHYETRFKRDGITNIFFFPHLSPQDFPRLYTSCDAFVLPTKAEGWGLPIIEAAASGLPIITTFYSGHTEFLDKRYIYEIDLEKFDDIFDAVYLPRKGEHGVWGHPSISSIQKQLRYVHEHQAEAREKGLAFSDIVRTRWSWDAAAVVAKDAISKIDG